MLFPSRSPSTRSNVPNLPMGFIHKNDRVPTGDERSSWLRLSNRRVLFSSLIAAGPLLVTSVNDKGPVPISSITASFLTYLNMVETETRGRCPLPVLQTDAQ